MPTEAQTLLIRLVMHHPNNPHLIDKLIILKGLPYEWVFKKSKYHIVNEDGLIDEGIGDRLLAPWEPDADVNIPEEVRRRTEPITFIHWYPDTNISTGQGPRTFKGFWEKRTVWGLKLDYSHGPSQELWTRIEDFIDKTLQRGEKMPEAVVVAKDQKSEFRTYLPKRGKTLSSLELIAMEVPVVDLSSPLISGTTTFASSTMPVIKTVITVPVDPAPPAPEEPKNTSTLFKCDVCSKEFDKPRALSMHKTGAHRREKARV